jgi:transposase InsO family protein
MSRARVAVLHVVSKQLTITAAAAEYGISRRHLHRLLARYREGGMDALEPRSRRPKTTPIATPETVRQRVIELRGQLTADGLDAGPVTIGWQLEREGLPALSTSTIRRILHAAGLITPEPRKRPRSSYTRFEMAQPNEMWQSDFIHRRLADGTDVEVLNWLDDHSRYLLSCSAHEPVTGDDVVTVFLGPIEQYGPPASTLTDNGSVYTSRFTGGRNAFEYVLPLLGVRQKNGAPGHPRPRARPSGSTRPCSAGSRPDQPPGPSPSFKDSCGSSASTTTNGAPTERSTVARRARPTAPPRKPRQPATDTRPGITACAMTGSTAKAR